MESDEDGIDIKIKQELECLNSTSEEINQLENVLSEKRSQYRTALVDSTQKLNQLTKKLGDCVSKARPYYDAHRAAKQAHHETQQAALHYERAVSMHTAAREMVTVAEQGMVKDSNREDAAWAEMLNHATLKVNEAEIERYNSEVEHFQKAEAFTRAEETVNRLEKALKSSIKKSRVYFDTKQQTQSTLERISEEVKEVELKLQNMKETYSSALHNLEAISDSIHAARGTMAFLKEQERLMLGERQAGVGAETSSINEKSNELTVDNDLDDTISNRTVLSDLRKFDSTEHLNKVFESSSIDDTVSFNSIASNSSSTSAALSRDTAVNPSNNSTFVGNYFEHEKHEKSGVQRNPAKDATPDRNSPHSPKALLKPRVVVQPPDSSSLEHVNNVLSPSARNHSSSLQSVSDTSNGEIVLTISGLAEMSTP